MPALLDFFKTRADQPLVTDDPATIKRRFERKRWSVFLSVTFGYGFFYVARINFSVAKRPLLDEHANHHELGNEHRLLDMPCPLLKRAGHHLLPGQPSPPAARHLKQPPAVRQVVLTE